MYRCVEIAASVAPFSTSGCCRTGVRGFFDSVHRSARGPRSLAGGRRTVAGVAASVEHAARGGRASQPASGLQAPPRCWAGPGRHRAQGQQQVFGLRAHRPLQAAKVPRGPVFFWGPPIEQVAGAFWVLAAGLAGSGWRF
jgi:hypothetical protein